MLCKNCGNLIADDAAFCNACGASTTAEPVANVPEQPVANIPEQPGYIPQQPGYVPQQPVYTPEIEDPGKGMGTAAFVLGIVSLSVGTICTCFLWYLGGFLPLIAAIVGIVMGKMAMNKSAAAGFENKKAKTGMILSIVATIVIVVFCLLWVALIALGFSELQYYY